MKQKRQLFPDKLWDLVNNQPTSGIHWSKNGKRIEIDRAQLEKFLQTRLMDRNNYHNPTASTGPAPGATSSSNTKFRSHNFDSFIRQLHFYGFKKTGNSYYHDKFQRDRPEALCTMKRKYSTLPQMGNNPTISTMLPQATSLNRHMSQVSTASGQSLVSTIDNRQGMETDQMVASSGSASSTSSSSTSSSSSLSSSSTLLSSPSNSTATMTPQKRPKNARSADTIKMYTIDSSGCEDGNLSFTNVRETSVKAVRNEKCVKISIPELMLSEHSDDSWPKTLVLENQNILSAYFIYKLN